MALMQGPKQRRKAWLQRTLNIFHALTLGAGLAMVAWPAWVMVESELAQGETVVPKNAKRKYTAGAPKRGERLAVFKLPRLKMTWTVLEGTDSRTLDRSIGHIEGTGLPGGRGNIGIAGHRNTHFRTLKWVRPGDEILIEARGRADRYVVEWTRTVEPEEVSVLDAAQGPAVTLVTCFPFEYIGNAPLRFVVRALPDGETGRRLGSSQ